MHNGGSKKYLQLHIPEFPVMKIMYYMQKYAYVVYILIDKVI